MDQKPSTYLVAPKVILLIGASGGVGTAIAKDLAAAGHKLALHYFQNGESIISLDDEIKAEGGHCEVFQANISKSAQVKTMMEKVVAHFGRIDVLVNNAGVSLSGMSWKMSDEFWQQSLDVNLTGPFYCTREVLPMMREQQYGRIVNITSVVAQTGFPGTVAYAASKAGLIGMTRTLSQEVANKGITVNCLALGYFDAGMLYTIPEEMREQIRTTIPVKEFGNTQTISSMLQFLMSDEAGYLTGQTLNLNGGLH